ncbi:MAG: Tn3 family transposase, partial [Pseudonocardiaceae bacterium]|nr:Tn3 family transposase [Pseudonocardiaceae bacterium]
VVPVPFARPNRKFFGSRRGMTWLNAMNDQGIGRSAKVVSGTVRDSLHMVDVIFGLDGGELPDIVVSDTAPTATWSSACWNSWASPTGQPWRTFPTRRAGGSNRTPTTGRSTPSPEARSTCGRSGGTGRTSSGWSPPSTPAPSAPTTSSPCSSATAAQLASEVSFDTAC